MFAYLMVAMLAVAAVRADGDPAHRVTCGEVEAQKDVNFDGLKGNWVAVESVFFKDGHPFSPENDRRPNACLWAKDTDTSDSGMTVKIESHYPNEDTKWETTVLHTIEGEDHKGRMTISSDVNDRNNWEFLLLESDPTKYMVYMLCQAPNEAGEKLPARVVLLARHAYHDTHESLSADEELAIERRVGDKLHLSASGIKPVKFAHECWATVDA